MNADKKVKAILVNIFGCIMKCDVIAEGIINAAKTVKLSVPLVVRLEGTNFERGKQLLKESGIELIAADDLADAAQKAVAATATANPKSQIKSEKQKWKMARKDAITCAGAKGSKFQKPKSQVNLKLQRPNGRRRE